MSKMLLKNHIEQGKLRSCEREWENKRKSNKVMNAQKAATSVSDYLIYHFIVR